MIPTTSARLVSGATLLVATALLSGCATKQDVRDLQSDLRYELQQIAVRQDSLLAEFRFQTMQTQDTLQSASREMNDIRGTLLRELRNISNDLATLNELAGQNRNSITQIRDEMRRTGNRSVPAFGGSPGGADRDPMMPGVEGDADDAYDAAMVLYQRGSNAGARAEFEDFLERFPNDEELGPLVHYNLGDIAEQEENLDAALAHFQQVRELFPTNDKVADALYRIGLIHMGRDENSEARRAFDLIVNTYGTRDSEMLRGLVQFARDRLREIRG